ncbi:MAG: hypothetical protein ACRDKZ_13400 [Actinomycetota bacterium]
MILVAAMSLALVGPPVPAAPGESTPRVVSVRRNGSRTAVLGTFVATIAVRADYSNPHDPEQISVEGLFVDSRGLRIRVPAYYHEGFAVPRRRVVASGRPAWKVKFTPLRRGRHTLRVVVTTPTGTDRSPALSFNVRRSRGPSPGFVRLDRSRPRYYTFSRNDRTFWPMGFNTDVPEFTRDSNHHAEPSSRYHGIFGDGISGPAQGPTPRNLYRILRHYRAGIKGLARAGGNAIRVILDSWWLPLELEATYPAPGYPDGVPGFEIGRYHPANAWIVDRILSLAARHGVYVILVAWDGQSEWGGKRYAKADVHDEVLMRRRLRYQVARWGHSPNLLAWELFNEAGVDPAAAPYARTIEYLRAIDHHRHLVFNSWTGVDQKEQHTYLCDEGPNEYPFEFCPKERDFLSWAEFDPATDRPFVLSEYGKKWYFRYPVDNDPRGYKAHEGVWASIAGHKSGALYWWFYPHVRPLELYDEIYSGASAYLRGEKLGDRAWERASFETLGGPGGLTYRGMVGAGAAASKALVWAVRTPSSEFVDRAAVNGNVVKVGPLPEGSYRVQWWDTWTGRVTSTTRVPWANGAVTLALPDGVTRDVAAKVLPRRRHSLAR